MDQAPTFPSEDQVEGFWSQDRIHAPRPISPLAVEMITDTMAIGFTRAHIEYGAPLDMFTRPVHHYLYSCMRPPTDPDELARRRERYVELPRRLDEVGQHWEHRWKPWLIERVRADRVADHSSRSNEELIVELDAQRDHMIEQWTIHGKINFGIVAAARFTDYYNEVFAPTDRTEALQLLQGFDTCSVDAGRGLWALSRMARADASLRELFTGDNRSVVEALRAAAADADADADADAGATAAFAAAFTAYLDEYGWRSDAVYDVADVTWREDPAIPLDALRGYLGLDDEHDPQHAHQRAVARRLELLAQARARLAGDAERSATFERYYEAARHNLPLTEDHAFWIDQSGVANVRRFLLQVGDRLVADGALARQDDVFYLTRDELKAALRGDGGLQDSADGRRRSMAQAATLTAPKTLGRPPAPTGDPLDPLVDALVVRLSGRRPPGSESTDPAVLTGLGASPGKVTGTARVVRSLAEASKLDDGDILVCEMTLPPWVPLFSLAAAVVSDTGGLMSHCAIVAREYGLPAVVGTQVGTRTIRDGMTITVDGDSGLVRLEGQ